MLKLYIKARDAIRTLHTRESGQDAFEYLLVIGAVSVVIVGGMATLGTDPVTGVIKQVQDLITGVLT